MAGIAGLAAMAVVVGMVGEGMVAAVAVVAMMAVVGIVVGVPLEGRGQVIEKEITGENVLLTFSLSAGKKIVCWLKKKAFGTL